MTCWIFRKILRSILGAGQCCLYDFSNYNDVSRTLIFNNAGFVKDIQPRLRHRATHRN